MKDNKYTERTKGSVDDLFKPNKDVLRGIEIAIRVKEFDAKDGVDVSSIKLTDRFIDRDGNNESK